MNDPGLTIGIRAAPLMQGVPEPMKGTAHMLSGRPGPLDQPAHCASGHALAHAGSVTRCRSWQVIRTRPLTHPAAHRTEICLLAISYAILAALPDPLRRVAGGPQESKSTGVAVGVLRAVLSTMLTVSAFD